MRKTNVRQFPFARMWQERRAESADDTRRFWDMRADEFNEMTRDKDRNERRELLAWLKERGAVKEGFNVLDLGCGAGRYALEFAREACRVTGIDISPKMIAHAQKNAAESGLNTFSFFALSWDTLDLDAYGFREAFDLAFASMSPAICSEETLMKFHRASRAHCFMSGFIEREDLLQRRLAERLFPGVRWPAHDGSSYFAFNVLWQHGIYADLRCTGTAWSKKWDVETAFNAYAPEFQSYAPERDTLEEELLHCLQEEEHDSGIVREVRAKTAWLHWKKT